MPNLPLSTLIFFVTMALLASIATAFQPGVNARFAQHASHPIHGGVINFAVGCVAMLLV